MFKRGGYSASKEKHGFKEVGNYGYFTWFLQADRWNKIKYRGLRWEWGFFDKAGVYFTVEWFVGEDSGSDYAPGKNDSELQFSDSEWGVIFLGYK